MFLHKSVGFFRTPTRICVMILCFYLLKKCCKPRLPDRHTQLPLVLRYAAKILYEIMLLGFLCLTKPAFMRRPWLGISVFHGIISTLSKQLRYSHAGKLCVPVGQPGLQLYIQKKISSEAKMQIPRYRVSQAQYPWHGLRFLRMPCLQRPLQFSPKEV